MKITSTYINVKRFAVVATMAVALIGAEAADKKPVPAKPAPRGKTPPAPAPEPVDPEQYKSVFEEPRIDPFFPKSLRFAVRTTSTNQVRSAIPVDQIVVRGILLGKEKTAIINGKIVAEGEVAVIKLPKAILQVRVIEIRERSVIIKVDPDPEPKEIYLRATP